MYPLFRSQAALHLYIERLCQPAIKYRQTRKMSNLLAAFPDGSTPDLGLAAKHRRLVCTESVSTPLLLLADNAQLSAGTLHAILNAIRGLEVEVTGIKTSLARLDALETLVTRLVAALPQPAQPAQSSEGAQ